jgi:hypothetical protein
VFGGTDVQWGADKFEIEALAKIESSWTSSTSLETCTGFEQQFVAGTFGNNFVADNSLLFRVDTGTNTYGNVTRSSLGVNLTPGCDSNHLGNCQPLFVPSGTKYALQTITQLKHPQPNNTFADADRALVNEFGDALDATLPDPGNPSSYPKEAGAGDPPVGPNSCDGQASGAGSGNFGIQDVNPFVAPTPPQQPNVLKAGQATDVNPASGGQEAGTVSTLTYDSTKTQSSSTEFSVGFEGSVRIIYGKVGASYDHTWATDMSQSFGDGTAFSGGVNDFQGFFNPYTYRLFECRSSLHTGALFGKGAVPVFLVNYLTRQNADLLPLNFVAPNLRDGTVGQSYAGTVFASGGVPDYTYSIVHGALPAGLRFDGTTGQFSGTPTAAGAYGLTIHAHDNAGNTADEDVKITVDSALAVDSTLPGGDVGVPYGAPLNAAGGTAPYTYLLTTSGSLPPGLTINNSAGTIQGTPTAAGTYCFGVYVADSGFPASTITAQPCVTIVAEPALDTTGHALPAGEVGRPYSGGLCCASGGSTPYTWSVQSLPAGLTLNAATGALSGTPLAATAAAGVDLAPAIADAAGATASTSATLKILPAPAVATATLPGGRVGSAYTPLVSVSGGDGGNHFALGAVGGSAVPPGVSIGQLTGQFAGTPSAAGTYTFNVTATDGLGGLATRSYTVRVDPAGGATAPAITSAATAGGAEGAALAFAVTAGGSPAPAVSETGALPAGVSFADHHDGSAALTGVPAAGSTGVYHLTLHAANGAAPDAAQAFTLTVTAPAVPAPPAPGTGVPAIYVANAGAGSVTEYAAGAAGDAAPVAVLAGPHTGLSSPSGVALDAAGNLYVANSGTNTVTEYAPGAAGDAVPIATLNGTYDEPAGLTVDGDGTVFVANAALASITTVRNGTTHAIADPGFATAVALDGAGNLFAANSHDHSVTEYAAGLTGSPAPVVTLAGSGTGLVNPTGVALDVAGDLFVANDGGGTAADSVNVYGPGADGSVPPVTSIAGGATALARPTGIALDQAGEVLVANGGADSVTTYAAGAAGNAAPLRTLAGPHTGLDKPAALLVAAAPWVRAQPALAGPVDPGATAVLKTAITAGPACALRWQVSSGGGAAFADIPDATGPALTLDAIPASHDGYVYRAACVNSFGSATTDPVTLTVRSPAATLLDPSDQTVDAGHDATFQVAARGYPAPSIQWQRSSDGGATFADVPGATSDLLTVAAVAATADGDRYRAVFTNPAGTATTPAARLSVRYAPAIGTQPADAAGVPGGAVTFTAHAHGNPVPAVQWQISTDGGLSFSDVVGATADSLTIAHTASRQDGFRFRAVFTNAAGQATSDPATLAVDTAPAIAQDPTDVTAAVGDDATFHAAASGSPAPAIQWQASSDGGATFTDLRGETGSDLVVAGTSLNQDGNRYRARFANPAGAATSRVATLHVRAAGSSSIVVNGSSSSIVSGSIVPTTNPGALVRIRSTSLSVARLGRRARDIRLKLYCEPKAGRDCTGTIKVRTHLPVNPSSTGHHAKAKRVTFITFAYSLPRGAIGVATGRLASEKFALLRHLRNVKVDVFAQVTDATGHDEVVQATVGMKTVKRVK